MARRTDHPHRQAIVMGKGIGLSLAGVTTTTTSSLHQRTRSSLEGARIELPTDSDWPSAILTHTLTFAPGTAACIRQRVPALALAFVQTTRLPPRHRSQRSRPPPKGTARLLEGHLAGRMARSATQKNRRIRMSQSPIDSFAVQSRDPRAAPLAATRLVSKLRLPWRSAGPRRTHFPPRVTLWWRSKRK